MAGKRQLLTVLGIVLLASGLAAHIRLHNPSNKQKLWWSNPANVTVTIVETGSDDIPDQSHMTAMRNGFDAWNADPGTTAMLVETFASVPDPCSVWTQGSNHLIFFDESNCSGFFPGGSGTVAVTPILFQSNGKILDADVIFNGDTFHFTTNGTANRFDVQDVGTHELGHLLGLDHSGWAGATMYPYVDESLILQRSVSLDDVHGIRDAYPAGTHGSITGSVARLADASPVAGAHLFVRDPSGRAVGGALAADDGTFEIAGLDADTYTVGANPLDFPVSSGNLQSGRTIETDFEPLVGGDVVVGAGMSVDYGTLNVGADVAVSLGRNSDPLPLGARIGASTNHVLSGSGLVAGTTLACSDPTITVSNVVPAGTWITFQLTTPGGAQPGHADLTATTPGGDVAILPAAVEVVPADPTVTTVTPNSGTDLGGDAVTITGTGFRAGARVIVGTNIYRDGAAGGCVVVDPTTITLTTQPSGQGSTDVVVMDETGVEGRKVGGFTFIPVPEVDTAFPDVGASAGGTDLVISGQNFLPGAIVRIDGVVQTQVTVADPTQIELVTDPGVAGGPYVLEVENAGGGTAQSAYTYVPQADPSLLAVSPATSKLVGGKLVTLSGANFTANSNVYFGADPDTGMGGTPASGVVYLDANTLQATSPAHAKGKVAVMVEDTVTGQVTVLAASFTYGDSSGGGGGGCSTAPIADPGDRRGPGPGALGFLAFVAFLVGASRLERRLAPRRVRA